ncbi:MAG: hypothetical protein IKU03_08140 [Bacteroidales bacterium]|nr:hypothetical protein [Bacteroidales bacterium]
MSLSKKLSNYRILCCTVAIVCLLLGVLLGVSLNLNSRDVLTSYKTFSSTQTQTNDQLSQLLDQEYQRVMDDVFLDSITRSKVEELYSAQKEMTDYIDSLRKTFIMDVNGEVSDQLMRWDDISGSEYFMIGLGNASALKDHLRQYQEQISQLPPCRFGRDTTKLYIDFEDRMLYGERVSWEVYYFSHAMAVEVVSQLDLFKQQVMMEAWDILRRLTDYEEVVVDNK